MGADLLKIGIGVQHLFNQITTRCTTVGNVLFFPLVGVWCKKLEVANIVSRIKQENFHTYAGTFEPSQQQPIQNNLQNLEADAENDPPQDPPDHMGEAQPPLPHAMHYFPGITLKFCVSDIGLQALQMGCKLLRRITMNKISNHSPAQVLANY